MNCRFCNHALERVFVDLGEQPSANGLLSEEQLSLDEPRYPLRVFVCEKCLLVQIPAVHKPGDLFTDDYVYFSSYSSHWVEHARRYVDTMCGRLALDGKAFVVEVASNDGYLLQHFVARGIPCLGVDPAGKCAAAAAEKGVDTRVNFFGRAVAGEIAVERGRADLVLGNNVFAHVPDINDFAAGIAALLKPEGVATLEFPHLAELIDNVQFDTIYDEHFSYFSFTVATKVLARHGIEVFDVERLPTHGGSLRVFAGLTDSKAHARGKSVDDLLQEERARGLTEVGGYGGFQGKVEGIKRAFLAFVADEKAAGRSLAAFGAAAKGNTFLNTCGVGAEAIDFVVDDTPAKQGKYLPGSHIPVFAEERIRAAKPDVILVLPWNHKTEIIAKLAYIRDWGGRFVTCIPRIEVS